VVVTVIPLDKYPMVDQGCILILAATRLCYIFFQDFTLCEVITHLPFYGLGDPSYHTHEVGVGGFSLSTSTLARSTHCQFEVRTLG